MTFSLYLLAFLVGACSGDVACEDAAFSAVGCPDDQGAVELYAQGLPCYLPAAIIY